MRTRLPIVAALVLTLLAVPTAALAHPASPAWDGRYAEVSDAVVHTDVDDVDITRKSDNVTFLSHVDPGGPTSDMQFQRREGRQVLRGRVIDRQLDIAVLGGTDTPGLSVVDVTDPAAPELLATVSCGGFHSDVAIWEQYVVQAWDGSARPCLPEDDPRGIDRAPAEEGLRVFDLTDPADPQLIAFYGRADGIPAGVHNVTINGEEGLAYLNMAEFNAVDPPWGFVDLAALRDGAAPAEAITMKSMRDWSPTAADGCHDSGLAPERDLYACAAITATYLWDYSDPRNPTEVAVIPNPGITIHHGARFTPDEQTLVLGDETGGAAAGTPEAACTGGRAEAVPAGATWFYDVSTPQAPLPTGVFSPTDTEGEYCTSHFYGFVRDTTLMVAGWYDAGIEIADYAATAPGVTGAPTSYAVFEPAQSGFFSAYAWHGTVYGSSFEYGATGRDTESPGRGLWAIQVEGIEDVEPLATDEGNVWGRWTPATSAPDVPVDTPVVVTAGGVEAVPGHAELPTDALAVSVVALGTLAAQLRSRGTWRRRRTGEG